LALRIWGLRAGYRDGLQVARTLAAPLLRQGPAWVARLAALCAGIALPLVARGIVGPTPGRLSVVLGAALVGAAALALLHGRVEGRRLAVIGLAVFLFFEAVR